MNNQKFNSRNSLFEKKIIEQSFPVKIGIMSGAQSFLYHWHDAVEVLYGLENSTTVGIMDEPYILNEGDITIIAPRENHCLFPSDYNARRLAMVFEPSFIFPREIYEKHKECYSLIYPHSSQWPPEALKKVKDCFTAIYNEFNNQSEGWQESVLAQITTLAVTIIRDIPKNLNRKKTEQNSFLHPVLSYLSSEYPNQITLSSCAKELGFNSSYLSQQFKKHTGANFHQYLLSLRLNKAEWLLENTDDSISIISESSGFLSIKTFHRVFMERYGISPGKYRKNSRNYPDKEKN